jgi:hypothetical protein
MGHWWYLSREEDSVGHERTFVGLDVHARSVVGDGLGDAGSNGIVFCGGPAWSGAHDGWLRRQAFDLPA